MPRPDPPRWSLERAQAMLPEVRQRTGAAVAEVEALVEERGGSEGDPEARARLDAQIARAVSRWIRAMEALGCDVKGAWLVDFDSGRGYYCWRWPEERLEFFHGYDEGFEGRIRIQ